MADEKTIIDNELSERTVISRNTLERTVQVRIRDDSAEEFNLHDRLCAELRLTARDNYKSPASGHTSDDCNRHYWGIVEYAHIPSEKKAKLLEGVIRDAFNCGYDVGDYLKHFKRFCEDNKL